MNVSFRFAAGLLALVMVTGVAQAQINGGFESGLAFGWSGVPAADITIISTQDGQFPTQGNQFVQIIGSGGPVTPGYGPHLAGTGLGQASILSRSFTRPAGANCEVQIDWNFFQNESLSSSIGDFISIDLIDVATNTLVQNMVFCDNGDVAGVPFYTGVPGAFGGEIAFVPSTSNVFSSSSYAEPSPSGLKRARADISGIAPGTMLRIDIAVANDADSIVDSVAYVDNFKVLSGGSNGSDGSLRVLGSASVDGVATSSDSGGDFAVDGPIDFPVKPGQKISIRASATVGGLGWALLAGEVRNDGADFGFDEFNLSVAGGISVIVDGLNPTTPLDVIIGTLGFPATFIEGQLPIGLPDGDVGLAAVMEDPTAAPLFIEGTATTRLEIRDADRIPVGDVEVLTAGGSSFFDDSFGAVDLSALNGGTGFSFYGVNYTECFVCSNGFVTFGNGDSDFSQSVNEMYTQEPRIAVLWDDFNPSATPGAEVHADTTSSNDYVTISWTNLAQFSDSAAGNNFSVQLFENGTIVCSYDGITTNSGLVGISPGGLSAPTVPFSTTDWSSSGGHNGFDFNFSDTVPGFESFGNNGILGSGAQYPNDLMTLGINGPSRITFVRESDDTGYRAFSGVR